MTSTSNPQAATTNLADEVLQLSAILAKGGMKDNNTYVFPVMDLDEGFSNEHFDLSRDDTLQLIGLLNSDEVEIATKELSGLLGRLPRDVVEGITRRLFSALSRRKQEIEQLEYEATHGPVTGTAAKARFEKARAAALILSTASSAQTSRPQRASIPRAASPVAPASTHEADVSQAVSSDLPPAKPRPSIEMAAHPPSARTVPEIPIHTPKAESRPVAAAAMRAPSSPTKPSRAFRSSAYVATDPDMSPLAATEEAIRQASLLSPRNQLAQKVPTRLSSASRASGTGSQASARATVLVSPRTSRVSVATTNGTLSPRTASASASLTQEARRRSPRSPRDQTLPEVFRRLSAPVGVPAANDEASRIAVAHLTASKAPVSVGGVLAEEQATSRYLEALLKAHEAEFLAGHPSTSSSRHEAEIRARIRKSPRVSEEQAKQIFDRLYKTGNDARVRRRVYAELGLLVEQAKEAQECPFTPRLPLAKYPGGFIPEGSINDRLYRDSFERRRRKEGLIANAPVPPFRPRTSSSTPNLLSATRTGGLSPRDTVAVDGSGDGSDSICTSPRSVPTHVRLYQEHRDREVRQLQRQEDLAEWRKHAFRPDIRNSQATGPQIVRSYSAGGLHEALYRRARSNDGRSTQVVTLMTQQSIDSHPAFLSDEFADDYSPAFAEDRNHGSPQVMLEGFDDHFLQQLPKQDQMFHHASLHSKHVLVHEEQYQPPPEHHSSAQQLIESQHEVSTLHDEEQVSPDQSLQSISLQEPAEGQDQEPPSDKEESTAFEHEAETAAAQLSQVCQELEAADLSPQFDPAEEASSQDVINISHKLTRPPTSDSNPYQTLTPADHVSVTPVTNSSSPQLKTQNRQWLQPPMTAAQLPSSHQQLVQQLQHLQQQQQQQLSSADLQQTPGASANVPVAGAMRQASIASDYNISRQASVHSIHSTRLTPAASPPAPMGIISGVLPTSLAGPQGAPSPQLVTRNFSNPMAQQGALQAPWPFNGPVYSPQAASFHGGPVMSGHHQPLGAPAHGFQQPWQAPGMMRPLR